MIPGLIHQQMLAGLVLKKLLVVPLLVDIIP